ncbi:MAG TPA: biotin/lipoyl-containing protein [Candidatus Thermoplasmatota archaeon]
MVEYEIKLAGRLVPISFNPEKKEAEVEGKKFQIATTRYGNRVIVDVGGHNHAIEIIQGRVYVNGEETRFMIQKSRPRIGGKRSSAAAIKGARLKPPMPGRIVSVEVKVGDQVKKGQPLLVLEAMKMQNEVSAPTDGLVKSVNVKPGQTVDANTILVEIE